MQQGSPVRRRRERRRERRRPLEPEPKNARKLAAKAARKYPPAGPPYQENGGKTRPAKPPSVCPGSAVTGQKVRRRQPTPARLTK